MIEYLLQLIRFIPNDFIWFVLITIAICWGWFWILAWGKQRTYEKEYAENERIREVAKVEAIKRRALEREMLRKRKV